MGLAKSHRAGRQGRKGVIQPHWLIQGLGARVIIFIERVRNLKMANHPKVIHSDPDILGGIPVFVGTRVPVKTLYDYLEGGDSLDEFLNDFPSVTREYAIAALELAREMTEARAAADR